MSATTRGPSVRGIDLEEWDDLAERAGASPFLRPGWVCAGWRAFGRGELRVLAVRTAGRLDALLPLMSHRGVLRPPSDTETPEFGMLAVDSGSAQQLAEQALDTPATRLDLAPVAPDGLGVAELLRRAAARGRRWLVRPAFASPYIRLTGTTWAAYEHSLDAKRRRELRRRRRRLEERGELSLEVHADSADLAERLALGLFLERSGWKAAHGTSIDSSPATRRFYHDIAEWAAGRGWLRLAYLRVDGRAIGFDLCLETARAHYLLKTGYDPEFAPYGPGALLRHAMIERAFAQGLETYEFLGTTQGDNNRWKLEWTDQTRELVRLQLFARSVGGTVGWAAQRVGPALSQRARAQAKRVLGPAGRDTAKRVGYRLRRVLRS
jgi:CelD/BcsL family acetyltransferase involved in cellulose biosynthesis